MNSSTENTLANNALHETILSAVSVAVVLTQDWTITWKNEAAQKLLGLPIDQGSKTSFQTILHDLKKVENYCTSVTEELSASGSSHTTNVLTRPNGAPFFAKLIATVVHRNSPRSEIIWVIEDIDEAKKAEKSNQELQNQLTHASKMASIGTLASGVAHEINNPLAIVSGNISLLREKLELANVDPKWLSHIKKSETAVDRISNIIHALRTYARADTEHVENVDLHNIILDTLTLSDGDIKKSGIQLVLQLESKSPAVKGNIPRLQQAIMALIGNARDAIDSLSDKTAEKKILVRTYNSEENLLLQIFDNGTGIPESVLPQIFDPFFTTKAPGKGTGLGLSVVHSIITAHGAFIQIESEVGMGTNVTIRFPKNAIIAVKEKPNSGVIIERLSGQALLVDDDPDLMALVTQMLESFGLSVSQCKSGTEAIEILKTVQFKYVLTDLSLPGASGDLIVEKARLLYGDNIRIIAITGGNAADYKPEQLVRLRKYANGYVKKPFQKDQLFVVLDSANQNPWSRPAIVD